MNKTNYNKYLRNRLAQAVTFLTSVKVPDVRAIMIAVSRGFSQPLQANAITVPQSMLRPFFFHIISNSLFTKSYY
jgi:hypothetical protein